MEFWGIEVKPGQTVNCEPGCERLLHLSQASLGESKKVKGSENVPIFVKVNDQKLVLGTLSSEKCAQISYDLVFEKEFELSHGSKDISVFFVGYRSIFRGNEFEDGFYDSDSEDDLQIGKKSNGKPSSTEQGKKSTADKAAAVKDDNIAAKLKAKSEKPYKEQVKVGKKVDGKNDEDDSGDEDDDEDDSDEDEDMVEATGDSSDEENENSEEEGIPEKATANKKREAGSASITPIPEKKAKVVSHAGNEKTGGDGKKGVHIATPHPAKQGGKPQQSPKSGGLTCKYCSRNFNAPNALEAHTKVKHSTAK